MNDFKKRTHLSEFWVVLALPWILDLIGSKTVFASVFGALLWGLCVSITVARFKTQDQRFRRSLFWALASLSVGWLIYWGLSFVEAPHPIAQASGLPRWLIITHAGLLAAGAGMVLVNFLASVLWIVQNSQLRKTSWERRDIKIALPNLEGLGKVSSGAIDLALASWGLGFFLAIINGILKWSNLAWFKDGKVLVTAGLWLLLAVVFQLGHSMSRTNKKLYITYVTASFLFMAIFLILIVFGKISALHERISWFV